MEEQEVQGQETEQTSSTEQVSGAEGTEQPSQQQLLELDSVDKFRFQGREWTPKDFTSAYMMQSDYTRKTQQLAEERKYYDNLSADLEAIKRNPQLVEKFKEVYPEKFHSFLGYVVGQAQQAKTNQSSAGAGKPQQGMDPAFMERFTRIESELNERKIQAVEAELDAKFKVMSDKYPMADEEAVIARAQALLDREKQTNPNFKISDKQWDALWKSVDDRNRKAAEKYYSAQVNKQKQANQKGRDVAAGGGTPGQAPKLPRSIKEASAHALQELEAT